jgi:hypothetical protein
MLCSLLPLYNSVPLRPVAVVDVERKRVVLPVQERIGIVDQKDAAHERVTGPRRDLAVRRRSEPRRDVVDLGEVDERRPALDQRSDVLAAPELFALFFLPRLRRDVDPEVERPSKARSPWGG